MKKVVTTQFSCGDDVRVTIMLEEDYWHAGKMATFGDQEPISRKIKEIKITWPTQIVKPTRIPLRDESGFQG